MVLQWSWGSVNFVFAVAFQLIEVVVVCKILVETAILVMIRVTVGLLWFMHESESLCSQDELSENYGK